jgi:hypothetical protein
MNIWVNSFVEVLNNENEEFILLEREHIYHCDKKMQINKYIIFNMKKILKKEEDIKNIIDKIVL